MKQQSLLLILILALSSEMVIPEKLTNKKPSFFQKIGRFLSSSESTGDPNTNLKSAPSKTSPEKPRDLSSSQKKNSKPIIYKSDKKDLIDPALYRKISSKEIQSKTNKYLKAFKKSCKSNDPYKRLDRFKDNIIRLRTYLKTVIEMDEVSIDQQMESKEMHHLISEENFSVLRIIDEDFPIKDKVSALETSFTSYYNYHYHQTESGYSNYQDWAQIIIEGILCIDGQSL